MFPMFTPELVHTEQARRLEGFRRWSRRQHRAAGPAANDLERPTQGHHRALRPVLGH